VVRVGQAVPRVDISYHHDATLDLEETSFRDNCRPDNTRQIPEMAGGRKPKDTEHLPR
jgi:hypothetical protein